MANQAKAANIRVAWVAPSRWIMATQDPPRAQGYNPTLEKFSDGVKVIAKKEKGGLFVDHFHPYLAASNRHGEGFQC